MHDIAMADDYTPTRGVVTVANRVGSCRTYIIPLSFMVSPINRTNFLRRLPYTMVGVHIASKLGRVMCATAISAGDTY